LENGVRVSPKWATQGARPIWFLLLVKIGSLP